MHVIYRRIDDDFLDPLHFRPDSLVGCPGLINAARAGGVTIANAVGNGVADDKLVYSYVPDLISYYLDEDPVLPNVPTIRLVDTGTRHARAGSPRHHVFKRVDGSGGKGLVFGSGASAAELDRLCADVSAEPRAWIAQPVVGLSTVPTWLDGELVPRHVDLRPFAVHDGESVWVLPGGLTRVALPEGGLVVNSSQGGGSKDTWVLSDGAPASAHSRGAGPDPGVNARSGARRLGHPDAGPAAGRRRRPGATATAIPGQARRAEPYRREPLLDRSLRGAGGRYRAHPRRPSAPPPRGSAPVEESTACSALLAAMGVAVGDTVPDAAR